MNIFPELKKGKWIKINLEKESRNSSIDFANPIECERWVSELHRKKRLIIVLGAFWRGEKTFGKILT